LETGVVAVRGHGISEAMNRFVFGWAELLLYVDVYSFNFYLAIRHQHDCMN
jgi:hypothetical protein